MKAFIATICLFLLCNASAQNADTLMSVKEYRQLQDSFDSLLAANNNPGVMSRTEVNASLGRRIRYSDSGNIYATPAMLRTDSLAIEQHLANGLSGKASNTALAANTAAINSKRDTADSYSRSQVDAFLFGKLNTATGAGYQNSINNLQSGKLDITTASTTYALVSHTHTISQVTGLQTILDGKQAAGSYYLASNPSGYISSVPAQTFTSITGKPTTLSGYGITDAYPLTGNPSAFLITETDPTVSATAKAITATNVNNWNTAYVWGNHATAGYATTASVALKLNISDTAAMIAAYMKKTFPSGANGITYNATTGVISKKRQETYTGTTDASGNYVVVFATPYAVTHNVQPNILGGTYLQRMITTASPTGFTINAVTQNTNTLLGIINLVAGTTVINGASIQVLVTEN